MLFFSSSSFTAPTRGPVPPATLLDWLIAPRVRVISLSPLFIRRFLVAISSTPRTFPPPSPDACFSLLVSLALAQGLNFVLSHSERLERSSDFFFPPLAGRKLSYFSSSQVTDTSRGVDFFTSIPLVFFLVDSLFFRVPCLESSSVLASPALQTNYPLLHVLPLRLSLPPSGSFHLSDRELVLARTPQL